MAQALTVAPDDERIEHAIIRAAQDDSIDIAKLQALLDMQRAVQHERATRMFNTAMAAAQAEMLPVARDAMNTHTRSRYARLETIDRIMRPIYTKHGFSVRFGSQPSPREGWMRIVCVVAHSGGHFEENYLDAPPDDAGTRGTVNKTAIQSVGSSVSYLRRYLLCMVFNIVLSDDIDQDVDGNGSGAGAGQQTDTSGTDESMRLQLLEERRADRWQTNLYTLLNTARTTEEIATIAGHHSVVRALKEAPERVKRDINAALKKAHERLAPEGDKPGITWDTDPLQDLFLEIAGMDLIDLDHLNTNAAWRAKVRAACEVPPDEDRINEAIEARRVELKAQEANKP